MQLRGRILEFLYSVSLQELSNARELIVNHSIVQPDTVNTFSPIMSTMEKEYWKHLIRYVCFQQSRKDDSD